MSTCKKCEDREEAWDMLHESRALLSSMDAIIAQATEAGMDTGRVLGILEAATALDSAGYKDLALLVRKIVFEDLSSYGHTGDA